jgi:hypothetical protein
MHHVLDQRLSDWKLPPFAWQSLPAQRSKLAVAALLEELDALTKYDWSRLMNLSCMLFVGHGNGSNACFRQRYCSLSAK